jgi:hypothetical protein
MAIAPGQPINAALARVDSSAPLKAELATGPIRTQARLDASARKIKQANEAMAEYKQKQETKKLKNQTVAYLQTLNAKDDPATQQVLEGVGVNFEDNKEVGAFIDVMGGSKSAMDTILETIQETDKLFKEAEQQRTIANQIQGAVQGSGNQGVVTDTTGGPTLSPESKVLMQLLEVMDPEDVKKYKDLISFEDPETAETVDVGAEVIEDFKNMKLDQDAGGAYVVNFETGTVKYKGKGVSKKEIKPGDSEYENFRQMYPDGVAELDNRRAFRAAQGSPKNTSTETPVMSEEERRKLFEKYNINP